MSRKLIKYYASAEVSSYLLGLPEGRRSTFINEAVEGAIRAQKAAEAPDIFEAFGVITTPLQERLIQLLSSGELSLSALNRAVRNRWGSAEVRATLLSLESSGIVRSRQAPGAGRYAVLYSLSTTS